MLESLESQQLIRATLEDESGISTSPSIHKVIFKNSVLLIYLLKCEKQILKRTNPWFCWRHFPLNSVVQSQKKYEIIHNLIDQLKYNALRQYLVDTAVQIRRLKTPRCSIP